MIVVMVAAEMEVVGPAVIVIGDGSRAHRHEGEDRDESESFGQTH
jgi:hypothetical protein